MSLPPCPARRFFAGESTVFFCAHPRMHARDQVVTDGVCAICPHWRQPPPEEFRPFTPGQRPVALPRGPCLHLGDVKELRDCPSCGGTVKVKVFGCAHPAHGETTLRECGICGDFQPRVAEEVGSVEHGEREASKV